MTAQPSATSRSTAAAPVLPFADPENAGLLPDRLSRVREALQREIDKGTMPGCITLIARGGRIGWFEAQGQLSGSEARAGARPMKRDSVFRIYSMTKPIVSVAIAQLMEDGHFLLEDSIEKFIPEFAGQKVLVRGSASQELVERTRSITIQDLLRHTSGIAYENIGDGPVQRLYYDKKVYRRSITNAELASLLAQCPLICQPGAEWNYSRSTDLLGRVVEVVSGKSLGDCLKSAIFAPLGMTETAFHAPHGAAGRIAEPFPTDPWSGEKVAFFDAMEKPAMESGGGGLVSTTMDYARFSQMLLNGGHLAGRQIIGRKTLELMVKDHIGPGISFDSPLMPAGHSFGLGFALRTAGGIAPFSGSAGNYFWSGMGGTFFWVDPAEDLFAVFYSLAPGQRLYTRSLIRNLVYGALA